MMVEPDQPSATVDVSPGTSENCSRYQLPKRLGLRVKLDRHARSPDQNDPAAVRDWLQSRPRPWAVDLFCGAGGLSLGLEDGGFSIIAAADSDPVAAETHAANIEGLTWIGDISSPSEFIGKLDEWGIENVDLIAGGPPCQPFSNAGIPKIGDLVRKGIRDAHDRRADLWRSFFEIVDHLNPRAVLFENVPDFARVQGGALLIALMDELRARNYGTHVEMLEAWRYRVPQHRTRLLVIGIADRGEFEWPRPVGRPPTVGQAIGDLPVVPADCRDEVQEYDGPPTKLLTRLLRRRMGRGEAGFVRDHVTKAVRQDDAEIYSLLQQGGTYLDVPEHLRRYRSDIFHDKYLRMSLGGLSRTITAHIAKDGYWYIHPTQDRTISVREAARIQTFPDRFRFAGHPTNRYRQIGNAVPPLLASAIASSLRRVLEKGAERSLTGRAEAECGSSFREDLDVWFRKNRRSFPWRDRDLSPWQILLIEMCLHRTRAEQVASISEELLELGESPDSFLANLDKLRPLLDSLGLHWRSEHRKAAAEFVRGRLGGVVPTTGTGYSPSQGLGTTLPLLCSVSLLDGPACLWTLTPRE